MSNASGSPENLTAPKFEKGQSGNPGGKPGSRTRLTTRFLNALADDFDAHGKGAIETCRTESPETYVKVIAALCPKEIDLKTPLQEATNDELRALLEWLRAQAARAADSEGAGEPRQSEPAGPVQTVQ